ncbi:hypothetical protein ABK040_010813 [Willaertia magna]
MWGTLHHFSVDTINNLPSSDNLDENQQPILMPKFTPTIIGTETREEEEENQSILFDNKFTVYEIKLVNSNTQEVHYLFRRFNEFITLKNKLLEKYPNLNLDVLLELPKMGWFWNDKLSKEVIEERKKYLLNFLNVITTDPNLASDENVLEFLQCDLHMLEKALSFFRSKLYNYQQRKEIKEKIYCKTLDVNNLLGYILKKNF